MKTIKNLMVIGLVTAGLYSFTSYVQSDEWVVPDKYKAMENPTDASDEDNIEIGEELYMKHCKSCHGKEGLGDGTKAKELDTEMDDLSSDEVQTQSDGELYYKSVIGRDDMPNFEKKIRDEEDRWLVINFIRTLAE